MSPATAATPTSEPTGPKSLEGHEVPPDRLKGILGHMAVLSTTALAISATLPLEADVSDIHAVMMGEDG
jgi:hypothetical protein